MIKEKYINNESGVQCIDLLVNRQERSCVFDVKAGETVVKVRCLHNVSKETAGERGRMNSAKSPPNETRMKPKCAVPLNTI